MRHHRSSSVVVVLLSALLPATVRAQPPTAPPPPPPAVMPTPPAPEHETRRESASAEVPHATPPLSAVPGPTRAEIRRRRVNARIDSTRPGAVIERRASTKEGSGVMVVLPYKSSESTWEQVCVTPCDVDLDRFSTYRVRAENHHAASKNFTLPPSTDALHLTIETGSEAVHHLGQSFTAIGVVGVIVGASLLVAASDFRKPDDARAAGGITGGAGIVLAAIGIPLTIGSMSRVKGDDNHAIATVYGDHGYKLPLLPDIDLGHSFTLTQRGITF